MSSALPWVISAVTLTQIWLTGNKSRWCWWLALAGQPLWLAHIVTTKSWGMLPMCLGLTVLYVRNQLRWRAG